MTLIGLNGQLGSGKDTIYERAKLKYPEAKRIGFADKLKDSFAALFEISREEIEAMKHEDSEGALGYVRIDQYFDPTSGCLFRRRSVRHMLQRYGTESHRDIFGDDFWIEQALKDYDGQTLTFVTDVRFPNEAEAIRERDGSIWRIKGPNFDPNPVHVSEQILDDDLIDVELNNTKRDDNFKRLDAAVEFLIETDSLQSYGEDLLQETGHFPSLDWRRINVLKYLQ